MVDDWKLFPTDDINDIALAINEKGVSGKFTSGEMGDAVRSIETGGGSSGVSYLNIYTDNYIYIDSVFTPFKAQFIDWEVEDISDWSDMDSCMLNFGGEMSIICPSVIDIHKIIFIGTYTRIIIPSNVTEIRNNNQEAVIRGLSHLSITFLSEIPPIIEDFYYEWSCDGTPTIYCPRGSLVDYKNAPNYPSPREWDYVGI